MNERFVKLKPLTGEDQHRKVPPDCECAFADSKCIKRVHNDKCPTNCLETGVCGGWGPRNGLPEKKRIEKNEEAEDQENRTNNQNNLSASNNKDNSTGDYEDEEAKEKKEEGV